MPLGPFRNFEDCVENNQDKRNPEAFCGAIQEQVEGGKSFEYAKAFAESLDSQNFFNLKDLPQDSNSKLTPHVEGKTYTFTTSSITTLVETKDGHDQFFVLGYISTSDIDLVSDMVTKAGITDMFMQTKRRSIKVDVEHEMVDSENGLLRNIIPVARIVDSKEDEKGLWVKALLNKGIKRFDEVWASLESKFLDAFSITFRVRDSTNKFINGVETRLIHQLDLLNVALTGNPINPFASITEVFAKAVRDLGKGVGEHNRHKEGDPMGDKTEEEIKAAAEAKATADAQAKIDAKAQADADKETADKVAAAAAKATADVDAKAMVDLKAKVVALEAENVAQKADIKKLMEHPILKAAGPDEKTAAAAAAGTDTAKKAADAMSKAIGPLDAV